MELDKSKKRSLHPLSNKPPYTSSSDGMESQAGVYSVNAQPGHYKRVQPCVTPSPTLDITTEGVSTIGIKFCGELLKGVKNTNNIL